MCQISEEKVVSSLVSWLLKPWTYKLTLIFETANSFQATHEHLQILPLSFYTLLPDTTTSLLRTFDSLAIGCIGNSPPYKTYLTKFSSVIIHKQLAKCVCGGVQSHCKDLQNLNI